MSLEGVMFYSTAPASDGYVLTSEEHTVRKTVADESATVSRTATATASPDATKTNANVLPTSGGHQIVGPLTLVAALALVGSAVAASVLLRRG